MARTIKKGSIVVAVGTKKGGFLFHSPDRRKWSVAGPFMAGSTVYHMILDPRDGRTVYSAAPHSAEPWGPAVYRGRAGRELALTASAPKFKEGSGLAVARVWNIEPGSADDSRTIYAGVEPAALFRSADQGDTWEDIASLNYHPTRKDWQPGGGGLCLHTTLVDPRKPRHLVVAVSAVGTFESKDGGRTWTTENRGVRADFMPNKYPEWGQCVHKLAWDASGDGSIFQQNHCGMYPRGPEGGTWTEVTKSLPSDFGFPIAAHPREKGTAYVVPLIGGGEPRVPEGSDGGLADDEQREDLEAINERPSGPERLHGRPARGHVRRCGRSARCVCRDEHGAAFRKPGRRQFLEDDRRFPSADSVRECGRGELGRDKVRSGTRCKVARQEVRGREPAAGDARTIA